jgi:hypothetical protein
VDVAQRFRISKRRMIFGIAGAWLISIALVVYVVRNNVASRTPITISSGLFVVAVCSALLSAMHVLMWGRWQPTDQTPVALVTAVEDYGRIRLRLGRLARYGSVVIALFTIGQAAVFGGLRNLGVLGIVVAFCSGVCVLCWVVTGRARRGVERELGRLRETRRQLGASEARG